MSWAFNCVGKPAAVVAKIVEEAAITRCQEPEESYRKTALGLAAEAVGSYGPDFAVKVVASGSQWKDGDTVRHNQLNLQIEPLYGFVE